MQVDLITKSLLTEINMTTCLFHSLQELSDEKKKLEDELKTLKEQNDEQKKFISALKSAISHFS